MNQGKLNRSYSQIATEMDRGGVETRRKAHGDADCESWAIIGGSKLPSNHGILLRDNTPLFISGLTELSSDH
jgi:hypothetical protein